jgi:ribulose-bisphosphate carboxylase large chain
MRKKGEYSSCELPETTDNTNRNQNRHYRFQDNFRWKGIRVQEYKSEGQDWRGIARQALIGAGGETTKFHLRYFEIEPDGYSSFEKHKHEHVVIGVRGKGRARVNRRNIDLNVMDVLYIKPDEPHRLYNPYNEPFGFFCLVNAKRDGPKSIQAGSKGQSKKR